VISLFVATALAGAPVISGTGGFDVPTDQPWAGVEFAVHPTNDHGVALVGRVAPAWGFGDDAPVVFSQIGFMAHLPEDETLLRGGIVLAPMFAIGQFRMPVQFGDPSTGTTLGIVPAVLIAFEFEWNPDAPLTIGFAGGPASTASDYACDSEHIDTAKCITWHTGFGGGVYLRKRTVGGVAFEARIGATTALSVGYAL
jgi:hypothetical protein